MDEVKKNVNRVYGEKVDLDGNRIRDFFDKRAIGYTQKSRSRNTTVLLGDADAQYAERWDSFEKSFVLPLLKVKETDNVLDIGCGVGRWAEAVIPVCKSYTGVDLSEEMIGVAREAYSDCRNAKFLSLSFQDLFLNPEIKNEQYQIIIITGVSMYLNDEELSRCYEKLCGLLAPGGILYLEESIGVSQRLSLNNLWSESLNDYYFAVYRTVEEYRELLQPLISQSDILKEGFLDELNKEELKETGHWYIFLKKASEE